MRKGTRITGAALATAVALMFVGNAMAADSSSAGASSAQVKCVGGNACKGQSACKSASSSCKGQNACKGKGYVMTSSEKRLQGRRRQGREVIRRPGHQPRTRALADAWRACHPNPHSAAAWSIFA